MKANASGVTTALLAIIKTSFRNGLLRHQFTDLGEICLAREVRNVQRGKKRLHEEAILGFTHAIIPKSNKPKQAIEGMTIIAV